MILTILLATFLLGSQPATAAENWRGSWNDRMAAAEKAWSGMAADTGRVEHLYLSALELVEERGAGSLNHARTLDALAYFYLVEKQYEPSEAFYEQSIPRLRKLLGPGQPRVANSIHNLGVLYLRQGKNEQAEPLVREALEIFTASFGPDHLETARACRSLSVLMRRKGRHAEADELEARAARQPSFQSLDEPER
jgi:tetratricopeptide (TPR) repeat protein